MIKATDLKLDNLVYNENCQVCKITGINHSMVKSVVGDKELEWNIENVIPIPISEEILNKNGFFSNYDKDIQKTYLEGWIDYVGIIRIFNDSYDQYPIEKDWLIQIADNDLKLIGFGYCQYIHELQNFVHLNTNYNMDFFV